MIPLAARRLSGLAQRGPALFMFLLVLVPTALLSACRNHPQEQQFQGTTLGTAYHLTLYAELSEAQRNALRLGIQGELARLEQQHAVLQWLYRMSRVALAWATRDASTVEWRYPEVATLMQAHAADRLAERLVASGIEHAMIEVGGLVRVLDSPRRDGWRLALDHAALPAEETPRHLALRHAALVYRLADGQPSTAFPQAPRLLAVSVVATTASEAWYQAHRLAAGAPDDAIQPPDRAARFVVSTPYGIDISHTPALETWLAP